MIQIVREELKGDIGAVDGKVDAVAAKVESLDTALNSAIRGVERLTGEVATTNRLIPVMLDTITGELRARRSIDEKIKTTQSEVVRHRELSQAETEAFERRTKAETDSFAKRTRAVTVAKAVGFVIGPTVLGAIIGYYFLH